MPKRFRPHTIGGGAVLAVLCSLTLTPSASAAPAPCPVDEGCVVVVNSDNPQGRLSSAAFVDRTTDEVRQVSGAKLGANPSAIAVTPDGNKAYVANFGTIAVGKDTPPQTVTVLDTRTGERVKDIPVGKQPTDVTMSPDGSTVYVVNSGTVFDPGGVSVISTATGEVTRTVTGLSNPSALALSPDGRLAYVTNQENATVSVIDTGTYGVADVVPLPEEGLYPTDVTVSPDGSKVFVAGNLNGRVVVLDGRDPHARPQVVAVPGFGLPQALGLTPDGRSLYVTEAASNEVAVIDTHTMKAAQNTIKVGRNPTSVAVSSDGKLAYVTSSLDDTKGLSVIDTATNSVRRTVSTGSGPFAVALVDARPGN
ncbi:beta-propeller fold lactonase family protein [Streptomyces sp. NPDC056519]|uniref:beta-propeller fold lactonase family protein n=1 Tax=Streptomyces sp. NPDC056519 TaxID=3345849 RepID=UPI0036B766FC